MKRKFNLFHPLLIFILAQLAWLTLVGLWIYWYVTNYQILERVDESSLPQIVSKNINVLALVWGLILLVLILVGMYFIFIYLNKQININRLYDSFIANISHELKSPLASMQLYLETIQKRKVPAEKQGKFLSLMWKDVLRLKNLINSILDIAMIEQKKMAYSFRVVSAGKLVQDLFDLCSEQFKIRDNQFKISGSVNCEIVADTDALKIVFDNLIDNAIKYSADNFNLTFQYFVQKKYLVLKFTDTGVGIESADLNQVFKKFHRLRGPNIPNVKGTGLGLFIVKEIIKSHGGKINVSSRGLNTGTTFKIELPIYGSSRKRMLNKLLSMSSTTKFIGNRKHV